MNDFHTASQHILNKLTDFFDSSWPEADVDLVEDTLTATLPTKQQYVINRHGVTSQIWVSSPFTGAHHFYFCDGRWKCTRGGVHLEELLFNEHKIHSSSS